MPALEQKRSISPSRASVRSTRPFTAAASATSTSSGTPSTSSATASAAARSRSTTTTRRAPSPANRRARAAPMPLPPPVATTTASRPSTSGRPEATQQVEVGRPVGGGDEEHRRGLHPGIDEGGDLLAARLGRAVYEQRVHDVIGDGRVGR